MDVCIIGAGSSGISSCQVLKARGIEFDCFEKGSNVGGLWRYGNDSGLSSAYSSLYINTSRKVMEYKAYPMPKDYPDYPHHSQIAEYFDDYVDNFELRDHIRFRTEVTEVRPAEGGGWDVTTDRGQTHRYRAVLVANGHHWNPKLPDYPGEFLGETIHSHYSATRPWTSRATPRALRARCSSPPAAARTWCPSTCAVCPWTSWSPPPTAVCRSGSPGSWSAGCSSRRRAR